MPPKDDATTQTATAIPPSVKKIAEERIRKLTDNNTAVEAVLVERDELSRKMREDIERQKSEIGEITQFLAAH